MVNRKNTFNYWMSSELPRERAIIFILCQFVYFTLVIILDRYLQSHLRSSHLLLLQTKLTGFKRLLHIIFQDYLAIMIKVGFMKLFCNYQEKSRLSNHYFLYTEQST